MMLLVLTIQSSADSPTIFSWPKSNDYQSISPVRINNHNKNIIVKDKEYGNEILIVAPKKEVGLNFLFTPKERQEMLPDNYMLSDYAASQIAHIKNDKYINSNDKDIIHLAKKIYGDEQQLKKIIHLTYQYCLENLNYGNPTKGLYTYQDALTAKETDCGGFSTLMASLLQVKKIPTRLVVGYVMRKNRKKALINTIIKQRYSFDDFSMHAWIEAKLPDDSWFPIDASVAWRRLNGLSKREGGLGVIPADRLVVSYGHNISFLWENKKYTIEILQNPSTIPAL